MPGRLTPPMPDRLSPQWAISALTSVPVAWPAAGCTTRPAGLSMTMISSSSKTMLSGMVSPAGLGRLGLRHRDRDGLAGVDAIARIADRAGADRDRAVEDQRLEARARQRGARRQHAVEPLAGLFGGDDDRFLARLRHSRGAAMTDS